MNPVISIVLEGYNQTRELGESDDTIAALMAQDYPLDRIELIVVGTPEQAAHWTSKYADRNPFHSFRTVPCENPEYYDLKNRGAAIARGDIVAFTDSDVLPRRSWVRAIVENIQERGADISIGPSLFGRDGAHNPDSLLMRIAAAITWGWIFGKRLEDGHTQARGFLDHNVAMRREVAEEFRYSTEFGRIIASPLLFLSVQRAGMKVGVHAEQQAVHAFWTKYWLIGLQFRYGHEVYHLRRLDSDYPNQWLRRAGPLEPLATQFWHMALDVPKWFRLNRALNRDKLATLAALPLFIAVSLFARTFEMLGMYSTIVMPRRTKAWAEKV